MPSHADLKRGCLHAEAVCQNFLQVFDEFRHISKAGVFLIDPFRNNECPQFEHVQTAADEWKTDPIHVAQYGHAPDGLAAEVNFTCTAHTHLGIQPVHHTVCQASLPFVSRLGPGRLHQKVCRCAVRPPVADIQLRWQHEPRESQVVPFNPFAAFRLRTVRQISQLKLFLSQFAGIPSQPNPAPDACAYGPSGTPRLSAASGPLDRC